MKYDREVPLGKDSRSEEAVSDTTSCVGFEFVAIKPAVRKTKNCRVRPIVFYQFDDTTDQVSTRQASTIRRLRTKGMGLSRGGRGDPDN